MYAFCLGTVFAQTSKKDSLFGKPVDMGNLTFESVNDVCDSLVWPNPNGQTITYIPLLAHSGYLTGVNSYGDKAKGNYFDLSSVTSIYITKIMLGLGPVNGANGGNLVKPVNIVIYDGTGGTPGAVLGTYFSTLGEMAKNANKLSVFTFTPAVALPTSKKIFLMLEYPTLAWNMSSNAATKDTLVLLSTALNQVSNPIAWEQRADNSFHFMEDFWGDINLNNHIYPLVSSVSSNCNPLNPLPVDFGSFTATLKEKVIDLNWQTLIEANNDRFVVEKSIDGLKFSSVGTMPSKAINGNHLGVLNYKFTDFAPSQGFNFYRIRQIDKDGKSEFSKTIKLNFTGQVNIDIILQYYPNPAKQTLMIQLGSGIKEVESIRFSDASGKTIRTVKPAVAPGGLINLSINELRSGLNFATIMLPDGKQTTIKVLKD